MIDWSKGYTSQWRVFEVDTSTWADGAIIPNITSAEVERDGTGDAPLLESGSIRCDMEPGAEFEERYIRIALTAYQETGYERVDVATLLATGVTGNTDYDRQDTEVTCRSVLYPAQAKAISTGSYCPKGINGAEWVAGELRKVCHAPVEVTGSFEVDTHIVFDVGMTVLECVWQVLDAGHFCIQIGGDGTIHVMPMPTKPQLTLDEASANLLLPEIQNEFDYSEVPNSYTAIEELQTATVQNTDPTSITSIPYRGYEVSVVDESPLRVNGESLEAYCAKMLEQMSTIPDSRTYSREYWPGVYPFSLVRGILSPAGIEGDYRVETQSLTCDMGIVVNERASKEVKLWQA